MLDLEAIKARHEIALSAYPEAPIGKDMAALISEVERLRELLAAAADDLDEGGRHQMARYFRERIEPQSR